MRRSFGIPDIVTDAHAVDVIAGMTLSETDLVGSKRAIAIVVIGELLRLASAGGLDQFALPIGSRPHIEPKPLLELCRDLVRHAHHHPEMGQFDPAADEALEDATMAIIDRMTASFTDLPFEDGRGLYFRSGKGRDRAE